MPCCFSCSSCFQILLVFVLKRKESPGGGCPKLCCFEIVNSNSGQISFLIPDLFQNLHNHSVGFADEKLVNIDFSVPVSKKDLGGFG